MIRLFLRFVGAFLRSWWWKWQDYEILALPETQEHRARVCLGCPLREEDICSVCRCLILSKTILAAEKCPLNYWIREKVARGRQINDY